MSEVTIQELHNMEADFLAKAQPVQYKPGQSLVTTCYDKEVPSAWIMLHELKRLNFKLPIEIFYRKGELTDYQVKLLEDIIPGQVSVKLIKGNAKDFISQYGNKHGWACKIYAIYESEYEENLWLDTDNVPIRDPSFLFQDEEYLAKGSLFWRDVLSPDISNKYHDNSVIWPLFQVTANDSEQFEAGQLLINKKTCWLEYALTKWYTDLCEIYFQFGGDPIAFKMAWTRIGILKKNHTPMYMNYHMDPNVPYGFIPFGPFHKGIPNIYQKWGGGTVMVQRDRQGQELFNHRNMHKWKLTDNPFMPDILNEQIYHNLIEELKKIYAV